MRHNNKYYICILFIYTSRQLQFVLDVIHLFWADCDYASQCSDCTTPLLIHNIFFFGKKDKTLKMWSQSAFEEDPINLGFVYIRSVVLYERLNFCECGVCERFPLR